MVALHGSIMSIWIPVSVPIAQAYKVPVSIVNLCAIIFSIFCVPMDLVSSYVYLKFRTDSVLRVATVIALCGVILRLYACVNDEFWPIVLGTAIIASVYAIFIDSYILIANKWFPDEERALASTILATSLTAGCICSSCFTAMIYDSNYEKLTVEEQNLAVFESTKKTVLYQSVPCIIFCIIMLLFIEDKPEFYPSAVAAEPVPTFSFYDALIETWEDKNFLKFLLA